MQPYHVRALRAAGGFAALNASGRVEVLRDDTQVGQGRVAITNKRLGQLRDDLMPFNVSANVSVQWQVNRVDSNGWVVALHNNEGISKQPNLTATFNISMTSAVEVVPRIALAQGCWMWDPVGTDAQLSGPCVAGTPVHTVLSPGASRFLHFKTDDLNDTTLVVELPGGAVRGVLATIGYRTKRQVVNWLGIPFAEPPVGDNGSDCCEYSYTLLSLLNTARHITAANNNFSAASNSAIKTDDAVSAGALFYKLSGRTLNDPGWPSKFLKYSVLVADPGMAPSTLAKIRQALPGRKLLAYTCMSWAGVKEPCTNCTGEYCSGCPQELCVDRLDAQGEPYWK